MRISNIVYNLDQIAMQNVFLLENKRNIIMDGKFTKILYSDNLFTTNGIFIQVPFFINNFSICENSPNSIYAKCFLLYTPTDPQNEKIIRDLIRIEYCILEFYKQIFKCDKKITTILKSQLHNGCIKTYMAVDSIAPISDAKYPIKHAFLLKISGIWEDNGNIGLTYKFVPK